MQECISVLIPDGDSHFALFVAHCLACYPNVNTHILSNDRWSPSRFSRHAKYHFFKHSDADNSALLDAVLGIIDRHKIDVVLPSGTEGISFALANHEALRSSVALAPLPDPASFQTANNKWLLSQYLEKRGVPGPPTILVTNDDLFQGELNQFVFPALIKPVTAWDGDGIRFFQTLADFREYLRHRNMEEVAGKYILQRVMPGFVVGVNILAEKGEIQAVTLQRGIVPNTKDYSAAAAIEFLKEDRLFELAQDLVETLEWSGFANIDTIYHQDDTLRVLDLNARFWGSLRGSLVVHVSFPYLACLAALDIPFSVPDYQPAFYFHSKAALRIAFSNLRPSTRMEHRIRWRETGLRFLLDDPLAESLRVLKQEFLDSGDTILADSSN